MPFPPWPPWPTILADPNLPRVLGKARDLLKTGFNAGSGYGEVWIRDLNTFIELSLQVNDPKAIREALLTFLKFQGPQGDIPDGYIPKAQGNAAYKYRQSALAPDLLAHKNTVETDQESSLVQAVRRYVAITKDASILDEQVDGVAVRERLGPALEYVLAHRFDARHGLVWGATTTDWGDVQPEHEWGVELDDELPSHARHLRQRHVPDRHRRLPFASWAIRERSIRPLASGAG